MNEKNFVLKMTVKEKEKFTIELIDRVKTEILKQLKNTPAEWDGVELRWFIKDSFGKCDLGGDDERFEEYDNFVVTNNLV